MPQAVPAWLGAPACDWSSPGARDAVIDQLRAQQSGSGSALSDGDVSLARLVVKAAPGSTVTIVSRVPDGAAGADASDDGASEIGVDGFEGDEEDGATL
jgi:hypothetical protein